jgi:hypothetical protein
MTDKKITETKTGPVKKTDANGNLLKKVEKTKVTVDTIYVRKSGSRTHNQKSAYEFGFEYKEVIYGNTGSRDIDSSKIVK